MKFLSENALTRIKLWALQHFVNVEEKTEAEYNALTPEKQMDGTLYLITDRAGGSILDVVYPIGSIYMSVNSTNPSILFGGTWEQLEDSFLVGAGGNFDGGDIGGNSSVTPTGAVGDTALTVSQLPEHSHDLNSHTHSYSSVSSINGTSITEAQLASHSHLNDHYHYYNYASATGSTAITTSTMPSHSHGIREEYGTGNGLSYGPGSQYNQITSNTGYSYVTTGTPISFTGSSGGHSHSISQTDTLTAAYQRDNYGRYSRYTSASGSGSTHTHGITAESSNTGSASGNTGNTGSGNEHGHSLAMDSISILPPYLSVYMWKRVA